MLFQRGQSGGAGVDDLFDAGGFGEGEDVSCLSEFVGGVGGVDGEVEEEGGAGLASRIHHLSHILVLGPRSHARL